MRLLILPGLIVALSCSPPLGPGDLLVGTWSSADATVAAEAAGATLTIPCIEIHFAPLRLDDSLTFHSTGVVTRTAGLVTAQPGDSFSLSGRVIGIRVVIRFPWIVPGPGPGADTLNPGDGTLHVCNA